MNKYGWRPSPPDIRDEPFTQKFMASVKFGPLPRYVDLHHQCPPIWAQGGLGSCTGHGSARAFAQDRAKLGLPAFMPSRLFAYYNARYLEGTTVIDAGASVRDVVKGIAKFGLPPETEWPYNIKQFRTRPSLGAYRVAAKYRAIEYAAIPQNLDFLKSCLAQGYVFVFGFTVYTNFDESSTPKTGLAFMPDGTPAGGHCVTCVGYNSKNYFCCANSWGEGWGDPDMPGHFWLPSEYITHPQLAADFWVIRTVSA